MNKQAVTCMHCPGRPPLGAIERQEAKFGPPVVWRERGHAPEPLPKKSRWLRCECGRGYDVNLRNLARQMLRDDLMYPAKLGRPNYGLPTNAGRRDEIDLIRARLLDLDRLETDLRARIQRERSAVQQVILEVELDAEKARLDAERRRWKAVLRRRLDLLEPEVLTSSVVS